MRGTSPGKSAQRGMQVVEAFCGEAGITTLEPHCETSSAVSARYSGLKRSVVFSTGKQGGTME